jgi:hypothetical protein
MAELRLVALRRVRGEVRVLGVLKRCSDAGEAQIDQLGDRAVGLHRQHDVVGLEIPMNDPRDVQRMEGAGDLDPVCDDVAPRQGPAREPCGE